MKIDCFIPFQPGGREGAGVSPLGESPLVGDIFILDEGGTVRSTASVKKIAEKTDADYTLICTRPTGIQMGLYALERMVGIAEDSGAGMVYADHYRIGPGGEKRNHPLIAYQRGSLREDFDFGPVLLFRSSVLRRVAAEMDGEYEFAGMYDLRLRVSRQAPLVHINEYLYSEIESDAGSGGQNLFAYVDPRNRAAQIEMEAACTAHLKEIGAWLAPDFEKVDLDSGPEFEVEASVMIPVRNRIRTIADAVRSALGQKTDFPFNVIVVDNHSTDGTTEVLEALAGDERLIHIIPENRDLGIGGCWNVGAAHPRCGRFTVQLDSDDVYSDPHTLQKIVDAFHSQGCAMVVGSYMLTDINMAQIPPGLVDHREWTPDNGRNNALRINGLGAPRAFYTPMLREIRIPNTSYGEDYALGLRFSRRHQIGRIYDVLYLCRRWDDNSDAALDIVKANTHNTYKDRLRTWEIEARIALNKNKR